MISAVNAPVVVAAPLSSLLSEIVGVPVVFQQIPWAVGFELPKLVMFPLPVALLVPTPVTVCVVTVGAPSKIHWVLSSEFVQFLPLASISKTFTFLDPCTSRY